MSLLRTCPRPNRCTLVGNALLALTALATGNRLGAQIPLAEYAQRRAVLASKLNDGIFVVRGGEEPLQDYLSFFQSRGFLYLTGYREAGASLVMSKRGVDVRWMLFVETKDPAQEVWSGRRYGPQAAGVATGLPARARSTFMPKLDSLLESAPRLYSLVDLSEGGDTLNNDDRFVRELRERHPSLPLNDANQILEQMRGRKSPAELELIARAAAISVAAHREAAQALKPGMNEFEIQALLEYTFRRNGADRPAYSSIVGSGENSTTLHYDRDDQFMSAGQLLVIDAAAQYAGYAADVTRTFPVSGTFTVEQRAVYQIVRDAQAAAERAVKPGTEWSAVNDAARDVLASGLTRLGLIESPGATYECGGPIGETARCSQLSLYYMHSVGHGIGLEVHDPDQFYYGQRKVDRGSAFTLEPGIYVRENLLDIIPDIPANRTFRARVAPALKKYANTGVRIEDDYVMTEGGLEWISCLPREASDVEALMRGGSGGPPARDTAMVNWYRGIGVDPADAGKMAVPKTRSCALPRM
jgi:Xaa-Pro aminopeptidase